MPHRNCATFGTLGSSVKLSGAMQAVHSALLVVACFGTGLAPLAAAHVRISDLSAADSSAHGALAWRRVDLAAASNAPAGAEAGHVEVLIGSGAPAAVLLGQLYRDAPLGAAAQWRAVVAAARAPAPVGFPPGSGAAGGLQTDAVLAPRAGDSAASAQATGVGQHDTRNPDPGSLIRDLAAFTSDAAAARALLRRLLPLQKVAAAAAMAASAAEADQDEAAGAGADAAGLGFGAWRLRGEARAVAGGAITDVAQELQRNACLPRQGSCAPTRAMPRQPAFVKCTGAPHPGTSHDAACLIPYKVQGPIVAAGQLSLHCGLAVQADAQSAP